MIDKHVVIEEKIQAAKPTSVESKGITHNGPYTYEVYSADSKQDALAFLKGKSVDAANYYIEVETPEGTFGRDVREMYEV